MQIGRYLNAKRIMLGLAGLGAAAIIACGSQEQQRFSINPGRLVGTTSESYVSFKGERLGNSEYILEKFLVGETKIYSIFRSDNRPDRIFPFIVGSTFSEYYDQTTGETSGRWYCIKGMRAIPASVFYTVFNDKPTKEECPSAQ